MIEKLEKAEARFVKLEESLADPEIYKDQESYAALMKERGIAASCACAGVPDRFIAHATRAQQWEECGLTIENIMKLCGTEK